MSSETLAGIIAEMREGRVFAWEGCKFEGLADRIETAYKLEQAETILRASGEAVKLAYEKWHRPGNAAAMREMLKASRDYFVALREKVPGSLSEQYLTQRIANIEAALSAPPRNCDIGTADEQARRFQLFCQNHRDIDAECSRTCPFDKATDRAHCQAGWSQLPYEGGAE